MPFAVGLSLAISAAFGGVATSTVPTMSETVPAQTVRAVVEEYFADLPIMVQISRCESHFRQFNKNGEVYRGKVNDQDVGVMQINEFYHSETAQKLGLDLHTIDGNLAYARYLYGKEGTRPWNSSKACWGKFEQANEEVLAVR